MWNTYQRLVMRTSPPSEKYEIFSPLPLPTLLISHPLLWRGLGRFLGPTLYYQPSVTVCANGFLQSPCGLDHLTTR